MLSPKSASKLYRLALCGWLSRHRDFDATDVFALMNPPPMALLAFAINESSKKAYADDKVKDAPEPSSYNESKDAVTKLLAITTHDELFDKLIATSAADAATTTEQTLSE